MRTRTIENDSTESLSGYVMDAACARKSPQSELPTRAQAHSRGCCLMGHCAESGYVLIDANGSIAFLDAEATVLVIDAVRQSEKKYGIRLQAIRNRDGESMRTYRVEEIADQ